MRGPGRIADYERTMADAATPSAKRRAREPADARRALAAIAKDATALAQARPSSPRTARRATAPTPAAHRPEPHRRLLAPRRHARRDLQHRRSRACSTRACRRGARCCRRRRSTRVAAYVGHAARHAIRPNPKAPQGAQVGAQHDERSRSPRDRVLPTLNEDGIAALDPAQAVARRVLRAAARASRTR